MRRIVVPRENTIDISLSASDFLFDRCCTAEVFGILLCIYPSESNLSYACKGRSTFAPSSHRLPRFRHPIKAIDSWTLGGSCRCAMTHICSSSLIGIHRTDRAKRDQYPRQCNRNNYDKENLHTAIMHTLSSAYYASITTTAGLGEQASSFLITFHGCEHNAPS